MKQIKVEPIKDNTGDLFIVNSARVSHNKWNDQLTKEDEGLIRYLALHKHTSPFRHPRHTFSLNDTNPQVRLKLLEAMASDPFIGAGIVIQENKMSISVLGMIQVIQKLKSTIPALAYRLSAFIWDKYPLTAKAYGAIKPSDRTVPLTELFYTDGWLSNYSFRCTAPISIARQLVKHQTMMSWNEVSRRYCSDGMELFDQEFRLRAENVKQGSGEIIDEIGPMIYEDYGQFSVKEVQENLVEWYEEMVDPEQGNLAPETVRGYMPLNMMTSWIWSSPKPAFEHMISLRDEGHSQKESQNFARKLKAVL